MINKEIGLLKKVDLIITVSEREKRGLNNINNIVVWGHPVVVRTLRMVSMKERTLTPSTNHSQKIIISLANRSKVKL